MRGKDAEPFINFVIKSFFKTCKMKQVTIFCISILIGFCVRAQKISQYSYWFDDAINSKVNISVMPTASFNLNSAFATDGLGVGLHRFNILFTDDSARNSIIAASYFVKAISAVTGYEYWFDDDYSHKSADTITSVAILNFSKVIDVNNSLSAGIHRFNIRFKADSTWGSTTTQYFTTTSGGSNFGFINGYEYWFDDDYSHKYADTVKSSTILNFTKAIDASVLTTGMHRFNIRYRADSIWGSATTNYFTNTNGNIAFINGYEYWYDNDYAHKIANTVASASIYNLNTAINATSLVTGIHNIGIRFKSDSTWSSAFVQNFNRVAVTVPYTDSITIKSCSGSAVYNGITYTVSTIKKDTVKNILGKDSIYKVGVIQVYKVIPQTRNILLSGCNSVLYRDVIHYVSTVKKDTLQSVSGCDSIYINATITIIYKNIIAITQTQNVWGCNNVVYKGILYYATTVVRDTVRTPEGCDSVYNTGNITVYKVTPTTINVSQSACNIVQYKGVLYYTSTVVRDTLRNVNVCDSIYTIATITIKMPTSSTVTKIDCGMYSWHGMNMNWSGIYQFDTLNAKGCDSLITLNLTINLPTTGIITKVACGNYMWHKVNYTTSGSYTFDSLNVKGCDSLTTLNLTINKLTTATITKVACGTYTWHGVSYTASGSYIFDTLNAKGCDSLTTLVLTINKATTATITKSVCNYYSWHGGDYMYSGTYTFDSLNVKGCDSLTTLILTINQSVESSINKTVCGSYFWHGTM